MKIVVIGAGYVGLVTGAGFAEQGHHVTCVDQSLDRIALIENGAVPFHEPGFPEMLASVRSSGHFAITADLKEAMEGCHISFIAVGTPSKKTGINLNFVEAAASDIGDTLSRAAPNHVVVCKSTVVPGTAEGLIRPTVSRISGRDADTFGVVSNPEFLREGSAVDDVRKPDRIVIGTVDEWAADVMQEIYAGCGCPVLKVSPETAELIKYAANTLLATLISFSNEIANLCEILEGTDVERVMDGVHLDRRLSPYIDGERISPDILSYLRAGCGFGGSCLPKDLDALRNFVNHLGQTSPLLDAVAAVNRHRAIRMVDHAERLIGNLKGQAVSLLGLAFKPDTDDLRESPALAVIDELLNRGARVCAHDPVAVPAFRRLHDRPVETFDTAEAALEGAAAVLIVTAWPQYRELDWPTLVKSMDRPVIIDGRNILHDVVLPSSSVYQPMGRAPA